MWFCVKIRVAYFYCQTYIWRPEREKGLQLWKMCGSECGWQLQKHWTQARPQPAHTFHEKQRLVFFRIQAWSMADTSGHFRTEAKCFRRLLSPASDRFHRRGGIKSCVPLDGG